MESGNPYCFSRIPPCAGHTFTDSSVGPARLQHPESCGEVAALGAEASREGPWWLELLIFCGRAGGWATRRKHGHFASCVVQGRTVEVTALVPGDGQGLGGAARSGHP